MSWWGESHLLFFVFCFVFMKLMELKLTVDGLEKERDFYFSKLRDIELVCQEQDTENNSIISRIIDILYATEVLPITLLKSFLTDIYVRLIHNFNINLYLLFKWPLFSEWLYMKSKWVTQICHVNQQNLLYLKVTSVCVVPQMLQHYRQ